MEYHDFLQQKRIITPTVGIELKGSYYNQAVLNLQRAEKEKEQPTLFDVEVS